jgi:hypothetical protein
VARQQDDIVFAADPAQLARPFQHPGLRMLVLTSRNVEWALPRGVAEQLFQGEAAIYREAVRGGALGFVVIGPSDHLLHSSFVHFQVRTKRLIGESDLVPLVAYCRTALAWRAQGLFSETLGHIMAVLTVRGFRRALAQCEAGNQSAVHSLERLGFRRTRRLRTLILLNSWCWQQRIEPVGRSATRFFTV